MTASPAIAPIRAWVIPATPKYIVDAAHPNPRDTYTFPWSLSFVEELRLIPQTSVDAPGGMGEASFKLLRATREEAGVSGTWAGNVVAGAYVCITEDMGGTTSDPASPASFESGSLSKVTWWGWIASIEGTQIAGTTDLMGTVRARGLGHLLDGTVLTGFRKAQTSGGYALSISSPSTANMSIVEGVVIGNAMSSKKNDTLPVYAFAPLPEQCGTEAEKLWTRWRLLRHILAFCVPPTIPGGGDATQILLVCADGSAAFDPVDAPGTKTIAGYLNDTSIPEVFDLRDLTLKGALDLLIPRSRGYGWRIAPTSATEWTITVYTLDADGAYAPVNTPTDVNLGLLTDIKNVEVSKSAEEEYDEVVVQGSPHVCGFTVGFRDGNLKQGWTDAGDAPANQQKAYLNGAKAETGDGGYASWQKDKKILRNNHVRQSPLLERVFTTFGLYAYNTDDVRRRTDTPGTGSGGAMVPLVPTFTWNGTSVAASDTPSRTPYLPTARILRTIPWPVGVNAAGVDTRDAIQKANPDYWPIRVFRYLASPPAGENHVWLDLLVKNYAGQDVSSKRGTPSVSPDDRSPAIRVTFNPPEILAKAQWTDSPGTSSLESAGGSDPSSNSLCLDYTSLVATVAVESDQKVEVTKLKPGLTSSSQVRRRLIIRDNRLHCWWIPYGTILGVKPDGTPDRITKDGTAFAGDSNTKGYLVRNDYPVAERIAKMTAAWAFQRRTSVTITRARPDETPAWASIGKMIGTLTEAAGVTLTVNTVVERIERNYSVDSPSMSIATSLPAQPEIAWKGGGSASPSAGGTVSASGGGTLAQQVQDVKQLATQTHSEARRVPLILPTAPQQPNPLVLLEIIDGNTVYNVGGTTYYGIKVDSVVGGVGVHYDPDVSTTPGDFTAVDGIGRAYLYVDGLQDPTPVLVALDSSYPIPNALVQGDFVMTDGTVTIEVGGDPADTIVCYRPVFQ